MIVVLQIFNINIKYLTFITFYKNIMLISNNICILSFTAYKDQEINSKTEDLMISVHGVAYNQYIG